MSETTPKPTDIADVLINAQDIIDSAVATINATRQTQNVLEENIRVTDKKIGVHNVNEEAHPDIRARLADMPAMIQTPTVGGATSVETGTEYTWTLNAYPAIASVTIEGYTVITSDGETYDIKVEGDTTAVQFKHTFVGNNGDTAYFTVQAYGNNNFKSDVYTHNLTITLHSAPDMSKMSCTLPKNISSGKTYTYQIGNITDVDDDFTNVSVVSNDPKITLTPSSGLQLNTNYKLQVAASYNGPKTVTLTFTAHDDFGLSASKQVSLHLNAWPVTSGFSHTFPTYPLPNQKYTFKVMGVTDPDGESTDITCSLSTSQSITFSKSSNIKLNEDVTATIGNLAHGTKIIITCTFKDADGATVSTTITATVNTPPNVDDFEATVAEYLKPNSTNNKISFTGASDVNGQDITYEIVNSNSVLTFGKSSGIADGEQVNFNVSNSAVRGRTYNITVNAVDESGGKTANTVGITINRLPVMTNVTTTIPEILKPGQQVTARASGATDADGQTLKYTITSDNRNVTIGSGSNIAANANFTVKAPTEAQLARGKTFPIKVTVSDGLESQSKTYNIKINQLANTSAIACTVPATMQGGTENKVTIRLSGGTEPDGHTFTYNITNVPEGLTFSKTSKIAANESIALTATKVSADTKLSFRVTATDELGEVSTTYKEFSTTVQPIYYTATPSITSPTNGASIAYEDGVTVTISAAKIAIDLS